MDTFTARTPVDLLAVVPYVIGFHPEDSVVLLTFGDGRRGSPGPSSFHARVDLPLIDEEQRAVATMLRDVVSHHGARAVGLVIYTGDAAAAGLFADLMATGLALDGVELIDALRVEEDRFFAADDPEDPGTPYDLSAHPFTVSQVYDGRAVFENRAALRDSLVGTDDDDARAVSAAASDVVDGLVALGAAGRSLGAALAEEAVWFRRRLDRLLEEQGSDSEPALEALSVPDAAKLLVLASFEALREVAWAPMVRAQADRHVELWRSLVRRAPADLRAGASGLLAFAAWLAGDGALAWCAIDRSLEADPDDLLAHHVASLLESAVAPTVWAPVPVESLRIFTGFGVGTAAS